VVGRALGPPGLPELLARARGETAAEVMTWVGGSTRDPDSGTYDGYALHESRTSRGRSKHVSRPPTRKGLADAYLEELH
jgi:hypothetical protein